MNIWRIVILASLTLYGNNALTEPVVIDAVAAVVNDSVILDSEVRSILRSLKQEAEKNNQKIQNDEAISRLVLDKLIIENIIFQMARDSNVNISEEQVHEAIENIAAQNNMTSDELRNHLMQDGVNYDTFKIKIRKEMLISKVRNSEVRKRIAINPQEVELLAKRIANQHSDETEFNLSHILVSVPKKATLDQLDKAKKIASTLIKKSGTGAGFDQLEPFCSSCAHTIKKECIGWKKLKDMPLPIYTYLRSAQKNKIIGPIHSSSGFHIFKVNDIRDGNQTTPTTEIHARHIFLRTPAIINDKQARLKLESLAEKIKSAHISFSAAAQQISEDWSSSSQGGDLGWRTINTFDPAFRTALMNLQEGEISAPVHSSFGWHLIQLIETRQVGHAEIAPKDRAYELLFNHKFEEVAQSWMQEQRESSYIKIINNHAK